MKAELLSMGAMYVDINATRFPLKNGLVPNTEVIGNAYEIAPGGSALNFARVCASMDLQPVFVGKVGTDVMGDVLTKLVTQAGLIPAFIQSSEVETNIGMNFIDEEGSSLMTVVGSANQSLNGEEVLSKVDPYLNDVKYIYFGGGFKLKALMSSYIPLAQRAHESNVKVVLDHGRITNAVTQEDQEAIRQLLPLIDYYLPSKDEFLSLWNVETIEEGFTKVRAVSDAVIVVKDAKNGAIGLNDKDIFKVPSFPVPVNNSVGAGDSFNAGFMKAQTMQMDFEESIRFACATAAIKISETNLPSLDKVTQLVNRE
jgi:sugar/nucleoside kinase (ribokinase family)